MKIETDIITAGLSQAILSGPRIKGDILKIKIRPVYLKDILHFQFESFTATQVFHKNYDQEAAVVLLSQLLSQFRQLNATTLDASYQVLISKNGKQTVQKKALEKQQGVVKNIQEHNRKKQYLLEEGVAIPFLVALGVMTAEGKVVRSQYDKFRQMNRFLEFIEDVTGELKYSAEQPITIVDFGCGKSYLTFAMYHYLVIQKGYRVNMIGLDLKEKVIKHCNQLADQFGYQDLHFYVGDIAHYDKLQQVDMVVTLHACDVATDYALRKAIAWDAKVILSVPCCQHELNQQLSKSPLLIERNPLSPILKQGILKERFASLLTDGLRAEYLETAGYRTQVLEFIDMEHTPKNLLIRAVKRKKAVDDGDKLAVKLKDAVDYFNIHPSIFE